MFMIVVDYVLKILDYVSEDCGDTFENSGLRF